MVFLFCIMPETDNYKKKFPEINCKNFVFVQTCITFAQILRGGAVAARWAHNPKVAGSSPAPATRKICLSVDRQIFFWIYHINHVICFPYQLTN